MNLIDHIQRVSLVSSSFTQPHQGESRIVSVCLVPFLYLCHDDPHYLFTIFTLQINRGEEKTTTTAGREEEGCGSECGWAKGGAGFSITIFSWHDRGLYYSSSPSSLLLLLPLLLLLWVVVVLIFHLFRDKIDFYIVLSATACLPLFILCTIEPPPSAHRPWSIFHPISLGKHSLHSSNDHFSVCESSQDHLSLLVSRERFCQMGMFGCPKKGFPSPTYSRNKWMAMMTCRNLHKVLLLLLPEAAASAAAVREHMPQKPTNQASKSKEWVRATLHVEVMEVESRTEDWEWQYENQFWNVGDDMLGLLLR